MKTIFLVIITFTFCTSSLMYSQKIIIDNGLEYITDQEVLDDNNVLPSDLPTSPIKSVKRKKESKKVISTKDVNRILSRGNIILNRERRNKGKCFEEVINDCETLN